MLFEAHNQRAKCVSILRHGYAVRTGSIDGALAREGKRKYMFPCPGGESEKRQERVFAGRWSTRRLR